MYIYTNTDIHVSHTNIYTHIHISYICIYHMLCIYIHIYTLICICAYIQVPKLLFMHNFRRGASGYLASGFSTTHTTC